MNLTLDFCNYKTTKYAVENYHYSKRLPGGKLFYLGVWEDGNFIGSIVFGKSVNINLGTPYGLKHTEVCELARVALKEHKTPVTKIIKIALAILKRNCPGIKLVISYADSNQGHLGKIYQAGNWIFTGYSNSTSLYYLNGRYWHQRSIGQKGYITKNWLGLKKPQNK